jgi:hypothetical protein
MTNDWDQQAEFVATVVDACGRYLWLVELGAGRQVVASIASSMRVAMQDLAPGEIVRIKSRLGKKTPRIVGYSDVDRSGRPTPHAR